MLRVSRIFLKAPEAFAGGRTGAEPAQTTNPLAIPGGKSSTPADPAVPQHKAPACGKRSPANGGMVYDGGKGHEGASREAKIRAQWWTTVEADQAEDFQAPQEGEIAL